ncbi:MAG: hypothetical protein LLG37_06125 [Spirochaetia bacterium]|nr:hypothetical protein [Spirochaetia bacterium]
MRLNDNETGDTLTYREITNSGTADETTDISAIKLWYQPAGGVFDAATAVYVGVLPKTGLRTWAATFNNPV